MSPPVTLSIDFGTSHTVAVLRRDNGDGGGAPLLFDGSPLLPSAVFVDAEGTIFTGRDAEQMSRMDPAKFEPNPKRRVDDGSVLLGDTELPVHRLFAAVLGRVRDECVRVAGRLPDRVVMTHPATWGPSRRLVLTDAAAATDFPAPELISEPVGAATYFAEVHGATVEMGQAVVVYDFGGGTFDVSIVGRTADGFQVWAEDGSADLGGVDIDHVLVGHLKDGHDDESGWGKVLRPNTVADRRANQQLYVDVKTAKEQLSRHTTVDMPLSALDVDVHLTREELEELTGPLLDRAVRLTQAVIRSTKLPAERIAGVFLVGGASRMPLAATMLHRATGIAPTVIEQPETVVAVGACRTPTTSNQQVTPAPVSPPSPTSPVTMAPVPVSGAVTPPAQLPAAGFPQPGWSSAPNTMAGPPAPGTMAGEPVPWKPGKARLPIWIHFGIGFPITVAVIVLALFASSGAGAFWDETAPFLTYTVTLTLFIIAAASAVIMGQPRPLALQCALLAEYGQIVITVLSFALPLNLVTVVRVLLLPLAIWAAIALVRAKARLSKSSSGIAPPPQATGGQPMSGPQQSFVSPQVTNGPPQQPFAPPMGQS